MNSKSRTCLLAALVLVAFTFTLAEGKCLNTDKMREDWTKFREQMKTKFFGLVQQKCAEENKENNEDANKKCAEERIEASKQKCAGSKAEENNKWKIYKCIREDLGVKIEKKQHMSYEQYTEKVLSYVSDNSKTDAIKNALDECKDEEKKKWFCGVKKMASGPCPEMNDWIEKIKKRWSKKQEDAKSKKD